MNFKIDPTVFSGFNRERIFFNADLRQCTTFHAGGKADILFYPKTIEEIQEAIRLCKVHDIPYQIVGKGSNILISDRGIRGLTIYLHHHFNRLQLDGNIIRADAGVSLSEISAMAAKHGLSGFEFASGIPGSLGGAVLMNASAYDGEMKDIIKSSVYLNADGEVKKIVGDEHEFSYRHSVYSDTQSVILEAEIELIPGDRRDIYRKINDFQVRRRNSQPLDKYSAGSAFKRPTGYFAGKLIADAGLKGYRVGDVGVSEKHAGFIVNYGQATALEINNLFAYVKRTVLTKFGVALEPEVRWVGDWNNEETAWKSLS